MRNRRLFLTIIAAGLMFVLTAERAMASCCVPVAACDTSCTTVSAQQTEQTITHITNEFTDHREWLVRTMFERHVLPAMMLFAEQITAMAMHQVMIIGTFLDAKHQLETLSLNPPSHAETTS